MKSNLDKPKTGKTTKIANWVKEGRKEGAFNSSNRLMVVVTFDQKRGIMKRFDLGNHEVVSLPELKYARQYGKKSNCYNKEMWIDDIQEILIETFPNVNIVGFSG